MDALKAYPSAKPQNNNMHLNMNLNIENTGKLYKTLENRSREQI